MTEEIFIPTGYLTIESAVNLKMPKKLLASKKQHDAIMEEIKDNKTLMKSLEGYQSNTGNMDKVLDECKQIATCRKMLDVLDLQLSKLSDYMSEYFETKEKIFNDLRQQGCDGKVKFHMLNLQTGEITELRPNFCLRRNFATLSKTEGYLLDDNQTILHFLTSKTKPKYFIIIEEASLYSKDTKQKIAGPTIMSLKNLKHSRIILEAKEEQNRLHENSSPHRNNRSHISRIVANKMDFKEATVRRILTKYISLWYEKK